MRKYHSGDLVWVCVDDQPIPAVVVGYELTMVPRVQIGRDVQTYEDLVLEENLDPREDS